MNENRGLRDWFLCVAVILGCAVVLSTETLSMLGALRRPWIFLFWVAVLGASAISRRWRPGLKKPKWDVVVLVCSVAIGVIVTLTGITAAFAPPNSLDAMAYHMPRVVFWAEQSSVRFFPTAYLNQIMLQPLAEYVMLHLYLLAGSDRLVNFVQWFAALGSILGVSAVAGLFGSNARGQAIAALFCATLPAGVLAASGAKNDWAIALWLIAAVYFALRFCSSGQLREGLLLGMATGCALLTKATAYLFLPPLLIAIFVGAGSIPARQRLRGAMLALVCALAINAPQFARNYQFSGSILGFDSAHGDGVYRWRNETFGWRQTVSNVLRNLSEQIGARSETWNENVYHAVAVLHRKLAIDLNDPGTTWPLSEYHPPKNSNHETDVPNRGHLATLVVLGCVFLWRGARRRDLLRALYVLGIVGGVVAFCFYLKWQPFAARLFLPLFVAGAPLASLAGEIRIGTAGVTAIAQLLCCLLCLDAARLPALQNWVRPLEGPKSVLRTPRQEQYFADLQPLKNQADYERSAALVAASGCPLVGIDTTNLQLEYPLIALLRAAAPTRMFVHTGVENASRRYPQPVAGEPCAVVCLDCLGDGRRAAHYSRFAQAIPVDRFVVFLNPPGLLRP